MLELFQPIFFNWYLSTEKTEFVDKSRVEPTIFSVKKISYPHQAAFHQGLYCLLR